MFLQLTGWPIFILSILALLGIEDCRCYNIHVFHLIDNPLWGETDGTALEGTFQCPTLVSTSDANTSSSCTFVSTDPKGVPADRLMDNLVSKYRRYLSSPASTSALTVGLYSIHSWSPISAWPHHPDKCLLPTDINIAESEESFNRFQRLFKSAFPGYHGNSTTHPQSGPLLQRSYVSEFKASEFLEVVPFSRKIKGAAYVASTCHGHGHRRPLREVIVSKIERHFRVDSLGKCHRSNKPSPPDAVQLKHVHGGSSAADNLKFKQEAISNYLFYLAFENTVEPGYVTEKIFDALKAGTVPVYLGPKKDCEKLIPFEKAVIYVEDYLSPSGNDEGGISLLAQLLAQLSINSSLYEEHLEWRKGFSPELIKSPLLNVPWPCRICSWASSFAEHNNILPGVAAKEKHIC